ncbi:hypothetical protein TSOC_011830 [Tetrabaena socialis]|uniref:phytol kinase n=1 Tax=Tetrabaena socialis TaxID=47790 RepID=A0A2J7ZPL9_9CHLO|nr:hypothetical protein TSOC_011830 [Tetrabaena socialis]|eukprot:PNH02215.1 hypothetical protein TSOC_011830 [Tetrabaena socialis]
MPRRSKSVSAALSARLIKQHTESLVEAFDALRARPSDRLSFQHLKTAAASAAWLAGEVLKLRTDDGPASETLLASLWLPERTCSALMALQAVSVRRLATSSLSNAEWELYDKLHLGIASLLEDLLGTQSSCGDDEDDDLWSRQYDLRAAAQQAAVLAVRMDALPACSALLAAAVADPGRSLLGTRMTKLVQLCASFLTVAGSLRTWAHQDEGIGSDSEYSSDFDLSDAGDALAAVASSSVLEHAARALLRAPDRNKAAFSLAYLMMYINWGLSDFSVLDSAPHSGDNAPGCIDCSYACSVRTILSGPCLQYAMAAHVVAQLAAADGGSVYGLAQAELLPPRFVGPPADGGSGPAPRGWRPPRRRLLEEGGLLAAMRLWGGGLLQRVPVPLVAISRRAVHVLSLRMLRLTTRSAAEHAAMRLQAQQQQQPRGAAGSAAASRARDGAASAGAAGGEAAAVPAAPPLAALVREEQCFRVVVEALRCAALSARPRPVLYGTRPEEPYGNPARQAEGLADFWGAAMPALHMLLECDVALDIWAFPARVLGPLRLDVPAWPAHAEGPGALGGGSSGGRWPLLGRLLAYGEPRQAAALLATGGKLIRLLLHAEEDGGALGSPLSRMRTVAALPLPGMLGALGSCAGGLRAAGEQQAPGLRSPSHQRLHLLGRAARQWLPAAAQLAVALLRAPGGGGGGGGEGGGGEGSCGDGEDSNGGGGGTREQRAAAQLGAVCPIAQWVPALVQAHLLSRGFDGGAASWRQLLLEDMGVVELLGAALGAVLRCICSDAAPSHRGSNDRHHDEVCSDYCDSEDAPSLAQTAEAALPVLAAALACMAATFPSEVAAAVRRGSLTPPNGPQTLRAQQQLSRAGLAAVWSIGESLAGQGPRAADPTYDWREGTLVTGGGGEGGASSSSSGALGAALLAAEAQPAGWPALRACCNPGCVELAGPSEAELPLRVCGGCGVARYCSGQCQKAHWAQGHRRTCTRHR